jgi:hypothetical protein
MNRSDRTAWESARTLADLGELTARWIEGSIGEQPGYCGPADIEDPARMAPVLVALNRTGFMTNGSQAGGCGSGYDGAHWEQRAAVEGFASAALLVRLSDAAYSAGLFIVAHDPAGLPRWRYGYRVAVPVTRRNGHDVTRFGVRLPRRHVRDGWIGYGICSREAVAALCGAWQVTVTDPEWGRPDLLWSVLETALEGATA